jgi:hypothetical protein
MRDLKDFTIADWICLLPIRHALKQARNDVAQRAFLKVRPKELEKFLEDASHLKGRNIANVVAFGQPWVLDFCLRMAERHLADATVLVFDNSREAPERAEIERVCGEHNVLYLGLPRNRTRHANRSHGLAMTWIFHHVMRALQPAIAAFIDHDLIPVERIELAKRLGAQPFYGRLILSKWAWSLWAGYCLYDFSAVRELPLNFLHDFSRGLDTGGRNWNCLYKKYPRSELKFADFQRINFVDPAADIVRKIRFVDGRWIHLRGVGHHDNYRQNADFFARIQELVVAGGSCEQILAAVKPH